MDRTIRYYLCESREEVGRLYGDNEPASGCVRMSDKIYAVYNKAGSCLGFHEDVHLITYHTLGRPRQALISEGLAMYFDRVWWWLPNAAWAQVLFQAGKFPKVTRLADNRIFHLYPDFITYPIAGAWVDYLISLYGLESFKAFYQNVQLSFTEAFSQAFRIAPKEFEVAMLKWLQTIVYDHRIYDIIRSHLKKRKVL